MTDVVPMRAPDAAWIEPALRHELEASLLVIAHYADELISTGEPTVVAHAGRIATASGRMRATLSGLRELIAGTAAPERRLVSLSAVVDEALAAIAPLLVARRTRIVLEGDDVILPADPAALTHIVANLLANAVKYGPDGGRVTIDAAHDAHGWHIAVCDEGPGVAPQDRERIFEPLVRLPGTGHVDGSGLGLTICRALAERHGGEVTIAALGPGATFVLTLPDPLEDPDARRTA